MAEFQKESLSLEETNRVRISLGLKPLDDDIAGDSANASQKQQDEQSVKNFQAQRDAEAQQRTEEETRQRIARAQNRRALARKLQGDTLGQRGKQEEDARQWVKAASARAKENQANRLQKEKQQTSRPNEEYSSEHLQGLRVAHDLDDLSGNERILTLRDADVLSDAEDELIDASLDRMERDRENQQRAQKPKAYTGLDEDESGTVLSKYDQITDAAPSSTTGFRLGDLSSADAMAQRANDRDAARAAQDARKAQMVSLDYVKNAPVSDYETADLTFKKSKKKKKRATPRVKIELNEDQDLDSVAATDTKPHVLPTSVPLAENLVDDEELAASLARARRREGKRSIQSITPEMVAKNLAAQQAAEKNQQIGLDTQASQEGITFDETTEFIRQIAQRPQDSQSQHSASLYAIESPTTQEASIPSPTHDASISRSIPEEAMPPASDASNQPLKQSSSHTSEDQFHPDDLHTDTFPTETEWADIMAGAETNAENLDLIQDDQEPASVAGSGIAGALQLLRSQGILEQSSAEQREREKKQLRYDAWMRAQKKAERQGTDADSRERMNRSREKREAEEAMDRFKDYTPDVKLEYHDEFGRNLTQKEAWKRLSHVFHGNAPGHKAQEKRLRRIAEEQRRERMLAGDTSTLSEAFQARSQRTGQAHMILSVGNHDHAPQDIDLLGKEREAQLAKTQAKPEPKRKASEVPSKKVKKQHATATPPDSRAPPRGPPPGLMASPGPKPVIQEAESSQPANPNPPIETPTSSQPAMKPAFAPISTGKPATSNWSTEPNASASSSEAPRERIRIALGKRKAL
ncbi:hypothetical protein MYAM1_000180 [Malassezia yamatoensis]|uniref:SART-1 protein n=1 Tax=Malassezia yamatoensis TaxID=253288 RepID=A0AAJ6CH54_9BASI|nr:hypothetical protein MYAM1_000180 [Malassezia yamatoensis]